MKGGIELDTSVFKAVKDLETMSLDKLPAKILKRLTEFIVSGDFRKNEFDKFICKNFRLSSSEVVRRWNCKHPDKCRTENSVRGTKSIINSYLISLLEIDVTKLNEIFVLNDEEALKDLGKKLYALSLGDFNPYKRFSFNIFEAIGEGSDIKEFSVADCEAELEFLKAIDYTSIYGQLQALDLEKVKFLLSVLQQPLIKKEKVEKKTVPELNTAKVEICANLGRVRGIELSSENFKISGSVN